MSATPLRFLLLTDGKAGHENQSRALCDGLGGTADLVRVAYPSRLRKALSYPADRLGLRLASLFTCGPIDPATRYDAVICAGSTAFYPGKVIARRLGIPIAAILLPRGYRSDFDCILAPAFDRPPPRPNLLRLPVNLTPVREAFYAEQTQAFLARHTPRGPAVGVILGGPNSAADLSAAWMKRQLDQLFAATEGRERWVTTSRRTPPEVEALVDTYPFDYKLIYSRDTFNPIPAFVSRCETLFVSAESTGMLSEAVTRGDAAVEVLMNLRDPDSKFARFIRDLEAGGQVHRFDGTCAGCKAKIDLTPFFDQARRLLRLP